MKNLILAICIAMMPFSAFAGGKLTANGNYYKSDGDFKPAFGLAIYEPLLPGVAAYNSWTGFGGEHRGRDFEWASTKHMIEFYISKVTLGAGFMLEYGRADKKIVDSLVVKAEYKLW